MHAGKRLFTQKTGEPRKIYIFVTVQLIPVKLCMMLSGAHNIPYKVFDASIRPEAFVLASISSTDTRITGWDIVVKALNSGRIRGHKAQKGSGRTCVQLSPVITQFPHARQQPSIPPLTKRDKTCSFDSFF